MLFIWTQETQLEWRSSIWPKVPTSPTRIAEQTQVQGRLASVVDTSSSSKHCTSSLDFSLEIEPHPWFLKMKASGSYDALSKVRDLACMVCIAYVLLKMHPENVLTYMHTV